VTDFTSAAPTPGLESSPQYLSEVENEFITKVQIFQQREFAYAMLQFTRPQTLAYGMNDSPVGLAAWIVEKFRAWSDCQGNIEMLFSKDELLTNLTIYWVTETINSSIRLYYLNLTEPTNYYSISLQKTHCIGTE